MTRTIGNVKPHDNKDLGWKLTPGGKVAHWYRTSHVSRMAITHCKFVTEKSQLSDPRKSKHCEYCALVESVRDTADEKGSSK